MSRRIPWIFLFLGVGLLVPLPALVAAAPPAVTDGAAPAAQPDVAVDRDENLPLLPEAIPTADLPVRESWLTADRPLTPMLQAIKAAWLEHVAVRAALDEELTAAADESAALAVQRRIESAARDLELRILRIQVDFARQDGRLEVAERLDAAIDKMLTPPTFPAPVERPAPAGDR